jgi:hypothetical protein
MGPSSQRKAILLAKPASVNAQHYIKNLPGEKSEFIHKLRRFVLGSIWIGTLAVNTLMFTLLRQKTL